MALTRYFLLLTMMPLSASAATPITFMWKQVEFENESGAKVLLQTKDDVLWIAQVTLHGKKNEVPSIYLKDLKFPVLSESDLVYSSSLENGATHTSISLVVPVTVESQEGEQKSVRYQFVFRNDKFVERLTEEKSGSYWSVKDSIGRNKP